MSNRQDSNRRYYESCKCKGIVPLKALQIVEDLRQNPDQSYKELAKKYGITVSTVAVYLSHVRNKRMEFVVFGFKGRPPKEACNYCDKTIPVGQREKHLRAEHPEVEQKSSPYLHFHNASHPNQRRNNDGFSSCE